jgi:hypothetical protein
VSFLLCALALGRVAVVFCNRVKSHHRIHARAVFVLTRRESSVACRNRRARGIIERRPTDLWRYVVSNLDVGARGDMLGTGSAAETTKPRPISNPIACHRHDLILSRKPGDGFEGKNFGAVVSKLCRAGDGGSDLDRDFAPPKPSRAATN